VIQFNLLPDVKIEYIKARRVKRTVVLASTVVAAVSVAIFVLLFSVVNFVQKTHLSNVQHDVDASKTQLKAKPELAKILTIQNQLGSLPKLHQDKPVTSRVFTYIQQLTPQNVSISTLTINFTDQTFKIEGSTDSLATVNTFVDTLKFTGYTLTAQDQSTGAQTPTLAFSEVVLANFGVANASVKDKNKAVTYSITLKYDPAIFNSDKEVTLQVAKKVTTRSETEKPAAVFQPKPAESTPTQGAN